MATPSPSNLVLERGPHGTVEYAVRSDGETMEAKLWLDDESLQTRARFSVLFRRLVNEGRITNDTQFRKLRNEVWEFKRSAHRLLCYRIGSRTLLTHHCKKSGRKCPPKQIERAESIGIEHIAWEMQQRKRKGGK